MSGVLRSDEEKQKVMLEVNAPCLLGPNKVLEAQTVRDMLTRGGALSDFITNQCTAPSKPPITVADIYEVCGRMASVEDWRDWQLADLSCFTSAIAGVSSVRVAGNEAAAAAYGKVQDMVDEMVREVEGLSEVFDPPYVLLDHSTLALPAVVAALAAWPPAQPGAAPAYPALDQVDNNAAFYRFGGQGAQANRDAATAFMGWMFQAGVTRAWLFVLNTPPEARP